MKQPPGPGTGARIVPLSEPYIHSVPLEVTVKGRVLVEA